MPKPSLTGTRIRARRNLRGIRQADLAREIGISASFLNLIEHNRRKVKPDLLAAIASALGVAEDTLLEEENTRLVEGARAAALRAGLERAELERLDEFTGRFPGWAQVLADTQSRVERLERAVEQMNDRMTHDPFLGEALHEIISAVTSVQSTAAILNDSGAIDPEWQHRFHRNILNDSVRLSTGAVALVNYIDSVNSAETGLAAPQEEVEAWFGRHDFHIPDLEQAEGSNIARLVDGQIELASDASRVLARHWLDVFRADALALPHGALCAALDRVGLAPDLLASELGAPIDQVLRRLALGPKSIRIDRGWPPFGLVICDASGTLVFRRPLEGFSYPRFSGACPLWPLYSALHNPQRPLRVPVVTAGRLGRRFTAFAAASVQTAQFDHPVLPSASMMIVPAEVIPEPLPVQPLVVGASCRTCPQLNCVARREPSILIGEQQD